MAFDSKPSTWLGAGYTLASSVAGFTTATSGGTVCLSELTDTEANATTGDIRKLMYAVCEKFWQAYNGTATADRPAKMRIFRSTSSNDAAGTESRSYTITFDITATGTEVASE